MKTTRFVRTLVMVSAVSLLGSTFAFAGPGKGGCSGGNGCQGGGMHLLKMIDRIPDLTEQQEDQLWNLARKFHSEGNETREKMMNLKKEYHGLLEKNADQKEIDAKAEEIGKAHAQVLKMKASHMKQIADVLTEEQQTYLKEHRRGGERCPMKSGKRGHMGKKGGPAGK